MSRDLSLSARFRLGFLINSSFMAFEYVIGFLSGSLILIADASHNLTDSVTLAISWLGNRIARKPADSSHTLGHGRVSVLAAFINSTILIAIAIIIFIEAYQRLIHPIRLEGGLIATVAIVGIVANGSVASLFRKDRTDINVKAAFTNMAFDTVFSVATLFAGLLILLTGQTWIDPIVSIGVGLGLLYAAFGILHQASHIFLEGAPKDLNLNEIRQFILQHDNVQSISELYVWAVSSNEYILSCTITPNTIAYKQLQATTKKLKFDLKELGFAKIIIEVT